MEAIRPTMIVDLESSVDDQCSTGFTHKLPASQQWAAWTRRKCGGIRYAGSAAASSAAPMETIPTAPC